MPRRSKESFLHYVANENETYFQRSLAVLALEYLSKKEKLTTFCIEEELIFIPELYGMCPSVRHHCFNLKNNPELLKRVEKFIKRTTKPDKRTPITKYFHEYNFVEIYLNHLRLKDQVPKEVFQCVNLRVLSLNGNLLRMLSPNVGRLKKLEVLLLTDNLLKTDSIPYSLTFCENLHTLHVDNNKIIALPGFLLQMKNLRSLRRLNTKYTVREVLTRTTMFQRSFKFFRIEKISQSMCTKVPGFVSRLETLAIKTIVSSKIDYFHVMKCPLLLQDIISEQYMNFFICDNCDSPIIEDFGYHVSTYRYGFLDNHWSVFLYCACNKICAEHLDELAFTTENRTKAEIDKKYDRYIQTFKKELPRQENNIRRCCTIL